MSAHTFTSGFFAVLLCLLVGFLYSCSSVSSFESFEVVETFDLPAFREPSGIVFHPIRESLFIVGDEGDLGEVSLDGVLIRQRHLMSVSFEGITADPTTGLLYIAIEGDDEVLKINPESFEILEQYALEQHIGNRQVLTKNKHGLEGITISQDRTSGISSLWITNQVLDHGHPEDLSGVFEYALPDTSSTIQPLELKTVIESQTTDLAGIFFYIPNNHLYVVSDKEDLMIEMTPSGNIIATYTLPGKTQEGITRDLDGFFYIAQDNGGVLKLRFIQP